MGKVPFASTCDVCGRRGPEYQVYPYCRECHADVCPEHDAEGSSDERNQTLCRACAVLLEEDAMIDQWEKPQEVDGLTLAFPADVSHLMPKMADIGTPPEKWVRFQQDWFFAGIDADGLVAREGIDKAAALRHLRAIQRSYAPKHEHKEAAVAYLASRWFTDESTWTAKPVRVGGISV